MTLFGVQLDNNVNRLNLQFKINWSKTTSHKTTLRNFFRAFSLIENKELVLTTLGFFLKKWELQVYIKRYGSPDNKILNWNDFIDGLRRQLIQQIFILHDTLKQEKIHIQALVNNMQVQELPAFKNKKMTASQIKNQFVQSINYDENGKVSKEDFINYYEDLCMNFASDEAFKRIIFNQWGQIYDYLKNVEFDYQQYKEQVYRTVDLIKQKIRSKVDKYNEKDLKKFFQFYDYEKGQKGFFQMEDLIKAIGFQISKKVFRGIFKKIDTENTGFITYQQFKNFLFN